AQRKRRLVPDHALAKPDRCVIEGDDRCVINGGAGSLLHGRADEGRPIVQRRAQLDAVAFCRARYSSCSWLACQPWNVCAPSGIVSETPTIGMLFCCASVLSCSVSGVTVCVLYTRTLIWWFWIWSWKAATSRADGSLPSEMAFMNSLGEIRFRPVAYA